MLCKQWSGQSRRESRPNAYVLGETCNLTVEMDNSKSVFDILDVKATLFRTIRLII